MKSAALATMLGLLPLCVNSIALGARDDSPQQCEFNGTIGPNILVASVSTPKGVSEIDGWAYYTNWCTTSQKISGGENICTGRSIEWLHVFLGDKFGSLATGSCYANIEVEFEGCAKAADGKSTDYSNVQAKITAKDGSSSYTYPCTTDREHHGCVYNGQLDPPSESDYTAFLSCGIKAVP